MCVVVVLLYQLNMKEMQEELKKRGFYEKKIQQIEQLYHNGRIEGFQKHYEKSKTLYKEYLNEIKRLDKVETQVRIARNKEFFKRTDDAFSKFNAKMAKTAGTLDGVLGVKLFGPLQQLSSVFVGLTKNVFKLGIGSLRFVQTWKKEGVGEAFKQTKIGQGASAIGRAPGQLREFVTGKSADERRAEKDKQLKEQTAQNKLFHGAKETASTVAAGTTKQEKFFTWFKLWEAMKWAWNTGKDVVMGIVNGVGKLFSGTIGLLSKVVPAIFGFLTSPAGFVALTGVAIGLAVSEISKAYSREADRMIESFEKTAAQEKKDRAEIKKKLDEISGKSGGSFEVRQNLLKNPEYRKLREERRDLEERINEIKETWFGIFGGGLKDQLLDQTENLIKNNEIRRKNMEIEQAKKISISEKGKTLPTKGYASGFPGLTTKPKKLEDLFGKITKQTNITVGEAGEEYLSVLNKSQYEKMKELLKTQLPEFSLTKKKKEFSQAEQNNQDESRGSFGSSIDFKLFRLKDASVKVDGLQFNFKNRVLNMLKEYHDMTNKVVTINSAYRSMEDQKREYAKDPNRAAIPGRSPHQRGTAVDINSIYLNEMDELGLIRKYGLRRPARTKTGEPETWHVQAQKGAFVPEAKGAGKVDVHDKEGFFVAAKEKFKTVFEYFELGKMVAEKTSNAIKNVSYAFTKDIPGRSVKDFQAGVGSREEKGNSEKIVKLLGDIDKKLGKQSKEEIAKTAPSQPGQAKSFPITGGAANYKSRSDVFPSDTLMTNMYAMMAQFSGSY